MFEPRPRPRPRTRPLLRTAVGEVLRRTRLDQGRTLAHVAEAARVSMPYLSELERGRKEASSEILAALCGALGIDLSELLADVRRELMPDRGHEAVVIRLGSAASADTTSPGPVSPAPGPAQSARGSGDAVCLLAAA
jgi:transcriptional regulator with XRE-family HTH domain